MNITCANCYHKFNEELTANTLISSFCSYICAFTFASIQVKKQREKQ